MRFILASKSPRRKEILQNLGLNFEIMVSDADESSELTNPALLVEELAKRKGNAVYRTLKNMDDNTCIISSDTIVSINNKILGKPHSLEEAREMINLLSGKTHEVISGIAVRVGNKLLSSHVTTKVTFDTIPQEKIEEYIKTNEPYDKAGGYAIQNWASAWIKGIEGDYFTVVGLPVNELNHLYFQLTNTYLFK